jgi:glycerophosphoryl diester phosphodiesterase
LLLHTWTFRPENRFLAADFRDGNGENARNEAGSVAGNARYIGRDSGFFSDDPGLGHRRRINIS